MVATAVAPAAAATGPVETAPDASKNGGAPEAAANPLCCSQESSPSKPLPPKTPAPSLIDAAAPLPGADSPPSSLTQALKQSGSLPQLAGAGSGSGIQQQQPWSRSPSIPGLLDLVGSQEPGPAAAAAAAEAATAAPAAGAAEGVQDDVLLFTAPAAVGSALDPQLLVHSPESSMAVEEALAAAAAAAAAGSPTTTTSRPNPGNSSSSQEPGAGVAPMEEGEDEEEADDGGCTPRVAAALHMPALDALMSPGDGWLLAELLQVGGWLGGWVGYRALLALAHPVQLLLLLLLLQAAAALFCASGAACFCHGPGSI